MQKKIFLLFWPILLIFLGLVIRLFVMTRINGLESVFSQPFIFQLLSFSLPFSVYFYLLLSCINGYLFYKIGSIKSYFVGIVGVLIYSISPWFIYADVSKSIYTIGILGVLMTIYGYLNQEKRDGFRLLLGGGLLLCYTLLFGLIYYVFLLIVCFRKEKGKLYSGFIPLIPLVCLGFYNIEGFRNIFRIELSLFNDIGIMNAINVFQGNLFESGWGSFGKLILNKFSYLFLVLFDSITRILSPVTFFSAERRMFGFSNLIPLSFILIIPLFFAIKKLFSSRLVYTVLIAIILLSIHALFSSKIFQLEKLLLISPFIVLLISFGLYELKLNKYKRLLITITVIFTLSFMISFIDLHLYEHTRLELYND